MKYRALVEYLVCTGVKVENYEVRVKRVIQQLHLTTREELSILSLVYTILFYPGP